MTTPTVSLDAISRPGGGFAMVAVDARESMRSILRDEGHGYEDEELSAFKTTVVQELGDLPTAVLCDPIHGGGAIEVMRTRHPRTGLIVAVDAFEEPRYGPLQESRLDEAAMSRVVAGGGVAALKLYLFWRPDAETPARLGDARRFVERCRELGVISLIEGVVTLAPGTDGFDDALVRAAEAFGATGPDVYKTQLPTFGRAADDEITRQAARVSDAAGVPWVVLSNGVEESRFPDALAAACRGGASGLLAGRAIWRPALRAADAAAELASAGRDRLAELIELVDAHATPWREAAGRA